MNAQKIEVVSSDDYETQLYKKFTNLRELATEFDDLRIEFEKLNPQNGTVFRLQQFADKLRDMRAEAKKSYDDF